MGVMLCNGRVDATHSDGELAVLAPSSAARRRALIKHPPGARAWPLVAQPMEVNTVNVVPLGHHVMSHALETPIIDQHHKS